MRFKIEITETLQKVVEVKAKTLTEAIIKVGQQYADGELMLDAADYKGYEVKEFKEGGQCEKS